MPCPCIGPDDKEGGSRFVFPAGHLIRPVLLEVKVGIIQRKGEPIRKSLGNAVPVKGRIKPDLHFLVNMKNLVGMVTDRYRNWPDPLPS